MPYNRNPNYNRWNNAAGETPRPPEDSTFVWHEPLMDDGRAASIETYSTRNGRMSAFSVYERKGKTADGKIIWRRISRIANISTQQAIEFLNNFINGKDNEDNAL